ncbi:EamA family transporter [Actinomadura rudentiformis]|uniref:EamA family transporter n=2 Tax=Actinomadura rudentiformis TaxID=359158 RepID=A0A6H9YUB4_9ACTN|nr:EamA family transporter [Actinomadura rudentiformis]
MPGELLALAAAAGFGITHFAAGLLARRVPGVTVALYTQLGGTVIAVAAAFVWTFGTPSPADLAWGALSGAGSGIGVAFLYRAMGRGSLSVVVPLSDVGAVAIPVLVGLAVLGDRPSLLGFAGIAITIPAIWLAATGPATPATPATPAAHTAAHTTGRRWLAPGVGDALLAGTGFAVQFLALKPVPLDAGLWPIAASRIASVAVTLPWVLAAAGVPLRIPARHALPALAVGTVGSSAIALFWIAAHRELLAVASVLAALYPVIPVVLALVFLRERVTRKQALGLCGAGAAIALLTVP